MITLIVAYDIVNASNEAILNYDEYDLLAEGIVQNRANAREAVREWLADRQGVMLSESCYLFEYEGVVDAAYQELTDILQHNLDCDDLNAVRLSVIRVEVRNTNDRPAQASGSARSQRIISDADDFIGLTFSDVFSYLLRDQL